MSGLKKFLFFINDVSNIALHKDREKMGKSLRRLKISLIVMASLLVLSLILNLFGFFE